jgi:hypothetical protein
LCFSCDSSSLIAFFIVLQNDDVNVYDHWSDYWRTVLVSIDIALNTAGAILNSWKLILKDLEIWQLLWAILVGMMTERRWSFFEAFL